MMTVVNHGMVLLMVLPLTTVLCAQMNICNYAQRAQLIRDEQVKGEQNVLKTLSGLRSRVECASYCLNEEGCKMSAFEDYGGWCRLLADYYSDLRTRSEESSSLVVFKDYQITEIDCPSAGCTGNQSCLRDCTDREGFEDTTVSRCTEIDPLQYSDDTLEPACAMYPTFQFKEYYLPDYSHNDLATTFWTLTFSKIFSWTALRITINGSLRGGYSGWNWWRVYIDDSLWSNPFRTEQIHYNAESDVDHHKSTSIAGLAYDVPIGNVTIELRSERGSSAAQAHFGGYTYGSRVYVEELGHRGLLSDEQPLNRPCPQLPSYNAHIFGSNISNSIDADGTLMSYGYLKLEEESTLKINADFVARVSNSGVEAVCTAWHIWIDDADCSPQPIGRIVAFTDKPSSIRNEMRSVHIEGYCTGVSKGLRNIQLRVKRCEWLVNGDPVADAQTGWNGNHDRIMVEEIHEGTDTAAIKGPDGNMYQIPEFNFQHWAWAALDDETDVGDVLNVTFVKIYSTTGLRLSLSADQRSRGDMTTHDYCCRLHFIINGTACTNPGEIEGITRINKDVSLHRPISIDGICEGVESGSVSIILRAAKCRGASLYGDCSFGWNSFTSMKASETFVEREVATYNGNTRTN